MNEFYSSFMNRYGLYSKIDSYAFSPPYGERSCTTKFSFAILLFILLLSCGFGFAQSTANYAFTTNEVGSLALDANGNTVDLSTGTTPLVIEFSDQGVSPVTNIGFNYSFFGNNFSQFTVSANGILQLGATPVSGSTYVASGGSISAPKFSAMGSDGRTASLADGGGVISKVVGTAPNRCLVIQWVAYLWYNNTTAPTSPATFQVRLYETSGSVEYVYGAMPVGSAISSNYSIGFSAGASINQVASITSSTNAVSYNIPFATNAYVANTNILNLHATSNGSRRVYRFAPPTAVIGDAADLTFTAVTGNSTTLNWADNATNEFGFLVTRAADVAFTQNVVTATVASTTAVGTGTAYTSIQTGLSPSTNYFYKIVALVEAGQSTGINGSQSTLPPGNVNAIASGLWSETTTWSTGVVPIATDIVTIPAGLVVTQDVTAANALSLSVQGDLVYSVLTARTLAVVTDVTIASGGSIKSAATGTVTAHSLVIGGSLVSNGTIDFSTNATTAGATITFNSAGNANFTLGVSSVTNLRNSAGVTLNKGTSRTNVLTFNPGGALTVQGANALGFMVITNGLLQLDGTNVFSNPLFATNGYTIGTNGGYWQNNPNATIIGLGGSPTINGLLRISSGSFNIGTLTGNSMGFGSNSFIIVEGGTINAASRFGVSSSGNLINYTQTGGVINVNQIGNISTTLASFDLGTNATSVINFTGGAVNVVLANTAISGPRDVRGTSVFLPNFTGSGIINFGTAASAATSSTYFISGNVPAFNISTVSAVHNLSLNASAQSFGNVNIPAGSTMNLNGFRFILRGASMVNNGTLTGTTAGSDLYFFAGTTSQSYNGSGVTTEGLASLSVDTVGNTFTVDAASSGIATLRVNLFSGNIISSSKITIGTGLALPTAVQIGVAASTNPGGSFDVSPTWNLGTGTQTLIYAQESVARTSGFEVNPTRIVANVLVDNTNGLALTGGDLTTSALSLTNGIVTTGTNTLVLGNATTVGTLTGGSATAYVNGALTRSIATANTNTTFVSFPIGKAGVYTPIALAPATTSIALFKAESFGSNLGTENPSIIGLSSARRFQAVPVSGTFDNINVRLSDAGIVSTNIPVQAPTAAGAYSSAFGSTATFAAGPPITLTSTTPVASANYTGFLSFANSNACSGTPSPGNTIASSNGICFGGSVILSLQNTTAGSGITYQWQSSADGITFMDIIGATASTYMATPTATTFYRATVTCAAGPAAGASTAVQVTFANNVTSTTPANRCGLGSVILAATPSAGATINWYANATGGPILASGNSFTTPAIAATTSYFASAVTATAGSVGIGTGATLTGATAQPTAFCNRWPNYWMQTIYTAAELNAAGLSAGNITSLAYNIATLGDAATNANFTVRIGSTNLTAFANTTFLATTAYTNVFGPATYTHSASGIQTITFTTPYVWDGISNIVINITHDGADAVNNAQTFFTATTDSKVLWVNSFTSATVTGTTSFNRLNIILAGQVGCESARTLVAATVTTPPALTLSAATATICEGQATPTVTVTSTVGDYDAYVITPNTGVTGNQTSGWVFNPAVSTMYTLTASQTAGSLCAATATFAVNVNDRPTTMTIAPITATLCLDNIQSLVVSGGTAGIQGKVGTGTAANILSTPFKNNWGGSKSQALYTAAELTAIGMVAGQRINSIGFVTLSNSATVLNGFTVSAGFITPATIGTTFIAGATNTVLAPVAFTASTTGNLDFALAIPLTWDGVSNLLIETCFNNNNSGSGASVSVESSTVASGLNLFLSIDNNPAVCSSTNAPSGTLIRPNLRISTLETLPITWSPIANLFTDEAATVPYVANANTSTVYVKSSTAAATTYTATATSGAGCIRTASTDITVVDCGIPYANIQFPGVASITTCATQTFYARVYKAGVTEAPGQGAGITAWIGRNSANTDPSTWSEASWQLATFNVQSGNDDEYQATFGPLVAGTYYVASRFVFASGNFVYGGYEAPPSGGGIWNGTSNINAVLNVDTPAPTASAQTFCNVGTVADLVATGTVLQWYADATGGTALAGTTALATGNYYASQTINNCESARTLVTVTVNVTTAPTATAQTFCNSGTVADLVATGTGIQWYTVATDGTALATTSALATGNYYASQTINNCESARTMVAVIVNVTASPAASAQSFCNAGTVADLVATGTGLQWYAAAIGGTALTSTTELASGNYYVSQIIADCESARTMVAVTVNVTNAPIILAMSQTFCSGATVADIVASGTNLVWYSNATGGSALLATNVLITGNYYVSQTINSCESSRGLVQVVVNVTAAPTASSQSFCTTATVADLVATGTGLKWYAAATGGAALVGGTALMSGNYFVSQTIVDCESTRTMVAVTINATAAPTGVAIQDFTTGQTLANFTAVGQNIIWYSSATGSTVLPSSTLLVSGATYYASQTVNGCESISRLAVTAGVDLRTPDFDSSSLRYYPNPVQNILNVEHADGIQTLQIFNMLGQLVYNKAINSYKVTIEMSGLAAGNYVMQVTVNGNTKNVKVIKK